jgi:glycine/D-amino acid oxidase-like deaminating enzyme
LRDSSRREFLSAGLIGLAKKAGRTVAGSFVNDSYAAGHRLRDGSAFRRPRESLQMSVVIVGGGIAGLSAAWRLRRKGFRDFVLLEMEREAGGNSRWGENEISRYPWGAHYVPPPGSSAPLVRELFEEIGLLREGHWEERHLCHSPQERLYLHGRWQEGLEPQTGASSRDQEQYRRFAERMEEIHASGEFTIPMERGARPSNLDSMTMSEWLRQNDFDSPYLQWYVDYACRDDYGTLSASTSAWAGIHYFASRQTEGKGPLTWAEGNGWIVQRLMERVSGFVRTDAMVYRVAREGRRLRVFTEAVEYVADAVIFAAPSFLASRIVEGAPALRSFTYAPWLTANLVLDRMPRERDGETAWDNVIYGSPALGYVVATHQSLQTHIDRTVWTFYWALAHKSPAEERRNLLSHDWMYWKDAILSDLRRAHPDIHDCVSRIDIMRFGHAMVRPVPGFLTSEERKHLAAAKGPVLYANSDLSGFSIFEEAQYRGVVAADRALNFL